MQGNNALFSFYSHNVSTSGTTGELANNGLTEKLQFVVNANSIPGAVEFLHKFQAPELELFFNNTGYLAVSFSYSTFLIWGV